MINLNPGMLPVHCCCDPAQRLGWVPVVEHRLKNISFISRQASSALIDEPRHFAAKRIDTEIALLHIPVRPIECYVCDAGKMHETISVWKEILAVKSNDYPITEWRKVAGFVEDRRSRGNPPTRGDVFFRDVRAGR
jgi:hypothetical protein